MRVWLCDEMFDADPFIPRLPLEMPLRTKKLRIGYMKSDPFFEAAAPCQRAVVEAASALRSRGHDVVEIKGFPSLKESLLIYGT
jgi:Asp-tRNA(Asn)/Glu-tRNA(Gln) amidotransferase A subunit family amidase